MAPSRAVAGRRRLPPSPFGLLALFSRRRNALRERISGPGECDFRSSAGR